MATCVDVYSYLHYLKLEKESLHSYHVEAVVAYSYYHDVAPDVDFDDSYGAVVVLAESCLVA